MTLIVMYDEYEGAANNRAFATLDEALTAISEDVRCEEPDLEDDRIRVVEVAAGQKLKTVWGFYGWHWDEETEQGALPGNDRSMYCVLDDDCWWRDDLWWR